MTREAIRVAAVSALVSVLVLGALAVGATAAADQGVPDDETVEIEENVTVWERAVLPLRADVEAAGTVVDGQRLLVDRNSQTSLNRDELAVFDNGTVPVEFSAVDGADVSQLAGENVSVLVGYDAPGASNDGASAIPGSVDDASDLLEDVNRSEGEEGTAFSLGSLELDEANGTGTYQLEADEPGYYSVALVHGDVFEDTNGTVDVVDDPDGTVVGVEYVPVQSAQSTVSAPDAVEPGEDVTVDVSAFEGDAGEGDVSHTVVLYDEATLTDTNVTLDVPSEIDENVSTEDVTVEQEIAELDGVFDGDVGAFDGDVGAFGGDGGFGAFEVPSTVSTFGTIEVDGLLKDATPVMGLDGLQTNVTGNVSLDASAAVRTDAPASEELTVGTLGNWTEGEYRYVHVATRSNETSGFETATGRLTVAASEDDGSDGGGPGLGPIGGGSTPGPVPGGSPIAVDVAEFDAGTTETVAGEPFSLTVTVRNAEDRAGTRELVLSDGDVELDRTTVDLGPGESREITFSGTVDEAGTYDFGLDGQQVGSVAVSESSAPVVLLTDAWLAEGSIEAGSSGTVSATVTNEGNAAVEQTLQLLVDGEAVDEQTVDLSAGESEEVQFTRSFDDPGEYSVAVDDTEAGTLTVQATQGSSDDGNTTTLIVLFGITFVLAVAGMGGYLYATGELDPYLEEE